MSHVRCGLIGYGAWGQHCDQLVQLAKQQGKVLAVGHELRHSSLWGKVRELIDSGDIGEPLYAMIEVFAVMEHEWMPGGSRPWSVKSGIDIST